MSDVEVTADPTPERQDAPTGHLGTPDASGTEWTRPEMNDAQQAIIDRLGMRPAERPHFEPGLREHLRTELERGIAPLIPLLGEDDLFLSKHHLERVHGCEARYLAEQAEEFAWTPVIARGIVAHKAIEIEITSPRRWTALDLVDEAIARLRNEGRGVGEWLQAAGEADLDAVRAEANNSVCSFQDCWPRLDRRWRPATEVPLRAELFSGRVILAGKPDLTIGHADGLRAGKVIVDFKTGRYSPAHLSDLRFYALLDAVRLGVPPRMTATYYLDAGDLHTEAITEPVLDATVARTVGAARRIVELRVGERDPTYVPSGGCRWCPALPGCEAGSTHLAAASDAIGDPDAD